MRLVVSVVVCCFACAGSEHGWFIADSGLL